MESWQTRFVAWCESAFGGALYRAIVKAERLVKGPLFGCQGCGQCVLRYTAFVCPMQCPKQLRNGPCGGCVDGRCEVYPDRPCVWFRIQERSRLLHREAALERILPEVDWSLVGTSSWLNHLAGKDARLFRPETSLADLRPAPQTRAPAPERQVA